MIRNADYYGLSAVKFSKEDSTALVVPSVSANLIRSANTRLVFDIRTPMSMGLRSFSDTR